MILTIPDKVSWRKDITSDSLSHYNKNIAKRILKTYTNSNRDGISFVIEPITRELLDWFVPVYTERIAQKNSPLVIDLYAKTLEKARKSFSMLIISENNTRVGGVIFSETDTDVNIAYKIFDDSWITSKLPASPSLYADYLLTKHGYQTNKKVISHGKDRNGYGKTSSIGLATFKISLGYKPYVPKKFILEEINTLDIRCDSLYFITQTGSTELTGKLFTTAETKEQWARLDSYQEIVSIDWIIR